MSFPTAARRGVLALCALLAVHCGICGAQATDTRDDGDAARLKEIVVTATLRAIPDAKLPASVTVLAAGTLRGAGEQQFADVLPLVPNLNWAGDTQRPRYFQIRGIGELEQYQGAPNPSVGFLIDDIDFSGLGGAATLFDVDRIEVLHGPQATLYGANALAGLIYVKSAAPSQTFGGRAEIAAGDYGMRSFGAVVTGPIGALDSAFRLAAQRYLSNGFYRNAYLGRSNTDNRDETTLRARWRYQPSDRLRVDLTVLHVRLDDGYDAWAIDNSRTTQSDQPSVDAQHSTGVSARAAYGGPGSTTLTMIATYADSLVRYGYDGDWGNPLLWAPYTYSYTEFQARHRTTRSLELRLGGSRLRGLSWLIGLYAFELREALADTSQGVYVDPTIGYSSTSSSILNSRYRSRNAAVYGQLDGDLGANLRWSVGLRGERRTSRYHDLTTNLGAPSTADAFNPADNLWGGHASVDYRLSRGEHLYALISRGYKAGGFNLSQGLAAQQRSFGAESLLNYEIGQKFAGDDGRLQVDSSFFYMRRHAPQLKTGVQLVADDPNTFVFYTGNARSGYNYGVENSLRWRATAKLTFGASLGWLQTLYQGFVQNGIQLPDRPLAHAPDWQAAVDAAWRDPRGPYWRIDLTGMGAFYYDLPPNPTRSSPYGLANAKLGWQCRRFDVNIWVRNVFDKNYTVRGFYFGDEPPNFPNKLYTQLGEPRNWGVHLTVRF
ncbi:MAG TPA: TonB-dependent receptor plug domain-containing protein [Steroidobacteraceae bacterium]|nr:TonB-dependent receptor plug domain-containing protein [Steroidobacteraceae bacterium]